ncbi:MAG: tetratricopeptide repeat protein [Pyrinomonadaceae bacterium]
MNDRFKNWVIGFLVVIICLATAIPRPASAQGTLLNLTAAQWSEDLRYLAGELPKRHKNLFHTITRAQFEKAVRDLDARIPTLTQNQIVMELARIVTMVGDGHTRLVPLFEPTLRFRTFPVSIYVFKEGVFIQAVDKTYTEAVGGRIVEIGKVPVEQIISKLREYVPSENEMGLKNAVPLYLGSPEVLQALGFVNDTEKVPFLIEKDRKTFTVELQPKGLISEMITKPVGLDWIDARAGAATPIPSWMKNPQNGYWGESGGYRYEYLKDQKVLYIQLNQVLDMPEKPLAQFFQEIVSAARTNDVEKLVLDVRQNAGGNNGLVPLIVRPIIQLEKLDQKGKVFVLIGRQTFSAAQNLVNALEKFTNATFVGEPTGSHVNMYGDARRFNLPNSKMTVRASTLWHQDNIELDKRIWTPPHVAAPLTFADYSKNIDTAMQAIFDYQPKKTLRETALELFRANDLKSFKAKALEFKNDPANIYQGIEADINSFGYRLVAMQKIDDAIEMFRVNTELYPNSANAFDSLGETLARAGKRDEAIKAYEKALAIDPKFPTSIEALKRLKGN